METMFFVLIGVALFALVVWSFLLQASLGELKELFRAGYNSNEGLYEANKERIEILSKKHNAVCSYMDLVMDHLGIKIVRTPSKDEVVEIEKIKKEKSK